MVWAKSVHRRWTSVSRRRGGKEAVRSGELLKCVGLPPDAPHTSLQKRASCTAQLALEVADRRWILVRRSWRLNVRHRGALQGKAQVLAATSASIVTDLLTGRTVLVAAHGNSLRGLVKNSTASRTRTSRARASRPVCLKDFKGVAGLKDARTGCRLQGPERVAGSDRNGCPYR